MEARNVPRSRRHRQLGRDSAGARHGGHDAENSERLNAGPSGAIRSDDDAVQLAALARQVGHLAQRGHVAVVNEFDVRTGGVEDLRHVVDTQTRRTTVHVAGHVGLDLSHEVGTDHSATRDRRTAGVDHHFHVARLRPLGHLSGDARILHARDSDLTDETATRRGQIVEVGFGETVLEQNGSSVDLDPRRSEIGERLVREDRESLGACRIGRPAGNVRLTGRQHGGDPAVKTRIDPVGRLLPRSPVADHRMNVVVVITRHDRGSTDVDRSGTGDIGGIGRTANESNQAVGHDDGVGVEEWSTQVAGNERADVA